MFAYRVTYAKVAQLQNWKIFCPNEKMLQYVFLLVQNVMLKPCFRKGTYALSVKMLIRSEFAVGN